MKGLKIFGTLILLISMLMGFAGCTTQGEKCISKLCLVAATGNADDPNAVIIKNGTVNYEQLAGDNAEALIDEIEAIPDRPEAGVRFAYVIRLEYLDEFGVVKSVEKIGYDYFPSNWDRIISGINAMGPRNPLSNSRNIVTVDSDFIEENYSIPEYIPEDVSLDDFIEAEGITYLTLFDPERKYSWEGEMKAYLLFNYYAVGAHRLTEIEEDPPRSSDDELAEFCERFDVCWLFTPESGFAQCIYNCSEYYVIRYDNLERWIIEQGSDTLIADSEGNLICRYEEEWLLWNMFVDPSGRFVVLSEAADTEFAYENLWYVLASDDGYEES